MLDVKALINKLLEAVSVDYIVGEGTSGNWTYRKWNSGIAECWGRHQYSTTGTTGWGNIYYNTPTATVYYPSSLFIEEPVATAIQTANGIQGMLTVSRSTDTSLTVYNSRGASSGSGTLYFSIHAIGKWK